MAHIVVIAGVPPGYYEVLWCMDFSQHRLSMQEDFNLSATAEPTRPSPPPPPAPAPPTQTPANPSSGASTSTSWVAAAGGQQQQQQVATAGDGNGDGAGAAVGVGGAANAPSSVTTRLTHQQIMQQMQAQGVTQANCWVKLPGEQRMSHLMSQFDVMPWRVACSVRLW